MGEFVSRRSSHFHPVCRASSESPRCAAPGTREDTVGYLVRGGSADRHRVVQGSPTRFAAAEAVWARIETAVAALRPDRWPDLRVGVGIGMAESAAEDTAAGLPLRSDQAMFRAKGRVRG